MSLVNFAIRQCLKRALLGRTLAESRVFDSMVVPIDATAENGLNPQIIVSTDDDQVTSSSFDLNVDDRDLDVIIEMEVANEVEVEGGGSAFAIPQTDAGLEATLDFMQRQVFRAMVEPGAPWADLLVYFMGEPKKWLKRRGASNEKGVKFAARQIVITVKPANEPAYGKPASGRWAALIALMRADDELADYGDLLAAEIQGAALPSWRALQASMGWTDAAVHQLGPAPVDPAETGEAPALATVILDRVDANGTILDTLTIVDGQTSSFEPVA